MNDIQVRGRLSRIDSYKVKDDEIKRWNDMHGDFHVLKDGTNRWREFVPMPLE